MNVIAFTGAFTAFLGATIAITQNDIKRVWLTPRFPTGLHGDGDGSGAYSAGLFHLMTHAYFKSNAVPRFRFCDSRHGSRRSRPASPGYADDGAAEVYAVYGDYLLDWLPRDFRNPTICWLLVER